MWEIVIGSKCKHYWKQVCNGVLKIIFPPIHLWKLMLILIGVAIICLNTLSPSYVGVQHKWLEKETGNGLKWILYTATLQKCNPYKSKRVWGLQYYIPVTCSEVQAWGKGELSHMNIHLLPTFLHLELNLSIFTETHAHHSQSLLAPWSKFKSHHFFTGMELWRENPTSAPAK